MRHKKVQIDPIICRGQLLDDICLETCSESRSSCVDWTKRSRIWLEKIRVLWSETCADSELNWRVITDSCGGSSPCQPATSPYLHENDDSCDKVKLTGDWMFSTDYFDFTSH